MPEALLGSSDPDVSLIVNRLLRIGRNIHVGNGSHAAYLKLLFDLA